MYLLILVSTVTGSVSISAFASLVAILIGIACSAVGLKICAITAEIKKYESIVNKKQKKKNKKKKDDQIVLFGKTKSKTIEVLISKALSGSDISQDDFISVNHVLKENNVMKEAFKIVVKNEYVWWTKRCWSWEKGSLIVIWSQSILYLDTERIILK